MRPSAGELVWVYDDRLQVTLDGKVVAEQTDWDSLAFAVACVPRARAWAEEAAHRDRAGRTQTWIGAGALVTGLVVGGLLISSDPNNADRVLGGLGAVLAGALGGAILLGHGSVLRGRADAGAIDAVNLYNDERAGCTPRP